MIIVFIQQFEIWLKDYKCARKQVDDDSRHVPSSPFIFVAAFIG